MCSLCPVGSLSVVFDLVYPMIVSVVSDSVDTLANVYRLNAAPHEVRNVSACAMVAAVRANLVSDCQFAYVVSGDCANEFCCHQISPSMVLLMSASPIPMPTSVPAIHVILLIAFSMILVSHALDVKAWVLALN